MSAASANKKRWPLPESAGPTAEKAEASRLFSRVQLGPLELTSRTWVPAMVPWRATEEGEVTDAVVEWYGRFADGRPGAIVIEATGIRDVPSGPLLRIGHDRYLPGLKRIVDEVRRRSDGQTKLLVQLIDFLAIKRRPERAKYLERFLALEEHHWEGLARLGLPAECEADVRAALVELDDEHLESVLNEREWEDLQQGYRERVTDVHLPHVAELPETLPGLFADAAERAVQAGFDGVELHFAHAYTMASFLSARNTREDGYGGPAENRARLPLEVFQAVRERVGNDFCVGCRFLGDEVIDGGNRASDAAYFGAAFARAGMDFLSISKGGKFEDAKQPKVGAAAYPYTGESGHECMPTVRIDDPGPFGRNLHLAHTIRAAVRAADCETPVVGAGGIGTFELAESALENGDCDVIASARQSLADPDWWAKLRAGRGAEVTRCLFTNYCEALDQRHLQVTCQLWDRDLEAPDPSGCAPAVSHDGKRRLEAPPWRADA